MDNVCKHEFELVCKLCGNSTHKTNNDVSPNIIQLIKQGLKIQAIKEFRIKYNVGLYEAKQSVDKLEKQFAL